MTDDDDQLGEHSFNSPLPPYERSWVHPSEHGRLDEHRAPARFDRSAARNLLFFAVLTCLATSIGMLVVALPGQIRVTESPETVRRDRPNSTRLGIEVGPGSPPIAAALTESGILVSVIDGAEVGQTVHVSTPESTEFDAVVLEVDPTMGVSVMRVLDGASSAPRMTVTDVANEPIAPGSPVWVATPTHGVELSHISSSTATHHSAHIPLEPFSTSHHGGAVFTGNGMLIGWCVERDGRHWLVPANALRPAVLRLNDDVQQP